MGTELVAATGSWGVKQSPLMFWFPHALRALPNAVVILVLRDGRDHGHRATEPWCRRRGTGGKTVKPCVRGWWNNWFGGEVNAMCQNKAGHADPEDMSGSAHEFMARWATTHIALVEFGKLVNSCGGKQ